MLDQHLNGFANSHGLDFTPCDSVVTHLEKIGEGYTSELYLWPEGVIKLFRRAEALPAAVVEAAAMLALQDVGFPMPRMLGTVMIEGRPGIVLERLHGQNQLSMLGRKPWMVRRAGRALAGLHAQIHAGRVPETLALLKPSLQLEIESAANIPTNIRHVALSLLAQASDLDAICHWDLHPANLINTAGGAKIIDWAVVCRGDPLADVARTSLLIRYGMMPPGAPRLVHVLQRLGRALLSSSYVREYRRLHSFDEQAFRRWQFIVATSRLACDISLERTGLLAELLHLRRNFADE
jgi:thiamine kinase